MNQFNSIKTDRLLVRTLEMKDKYDIFKYRIMQDITQFQSWKPENISDVEEFIIANNKIEFKTRNSWLQLAICLMEGQMIGDIGIHFLEDEYQVEIGYTLSPEFQGKGYAIEAVRAVLDFMFLKLDMHRVIGSIDPDNIKSKKLLMNLGFRKEAHFIKSYRMNNQWYDDCVYAILAEEWNSQK